MMTVNDVLKIARAQIGYTESPANSNKTKYGEWFGMNGQPWCMMFIQWLFYQVGEPLPYRTASCSLLLDWYDKQRPHQVFYNPQPGDIAIYNFGHVGIVESVKGSYIDAIEGNTSPTNSGSQDNGGGVYRRTRKKSTVKAFIRPNYKEEVEEVTQAEFNKMATEWLSSLDKRQLPAWAAAELKEAVDMGITDGSNPMGLVPRYQAAIMAKRAVKARE